MNRLEYLAVPIVAFLLASCVTSGSHWWFDEERGSASVFKHPSKDRNIIQKLISVPLNPRNQLEGRFEQYYSVITPLAAKAKKTVLFVSGGPGQMALPTDGTYAEFLVEDEFNIVYFHLRGSGFSQIHPSNEFDKYLRTSYAVEDIEEIRQDLVRGGFMREDGKWDAIIAYSYGTVLTQMYAYRYENKVDKVVLIAPLTRTVMSEVNQARDNLRRTLDKIYKATDRVPSLTLVSGKMTSILDVRGTEFSDLSPGDKQRILDEIFGSTNIFGIHDPGLLERAETAFGNIQFVVDHYANLKKRGELSRYKLEKYDCSVFQQLRLLRLYGWYGKRTALNAQKDIGRILRDGIIKDSIDGKDDCQREGPLSVNSSERAFYTINNWDGISVRLLREWVFNGRSDIRGALRKSAGEAHENRRVNDSIEKVGMDENEIFEAWDPLRYKHNRPTLILSGDADPIATGDQVRDFHKNALSGSRMLIRFPGVGHEISLPELSSERKVRGLSGSLRLDKARIPPSSIRTISATINGLGLTKHLALQLIPPNDLETELHVVGFGRSISVGGEPGNKVVVAIENRGLSKVPSSPKVWKIVNEFFTGTVTLNFDEMKPGEIKTLEAPLGFASFNPKYRVIVQPPDSFREANIDLDCYRALPGGGIHLFLHNKDPLRMTTPFGRWAVAVGDFFKTSFFLNTTGMPPPGRRQIRPLKSDTVPLPKEGLWSWEHTTNTDACIPSGLPVGPTIKIKVLANRNIEPPERGIWKLSNLLAVLTLEASLGQMKDNEMKELTASVAFAWNDTLEIMSFWKDKEDNCKNSVCLLGFNVIDEHRVDLLLKNGASGDRTVGGEANDWFYALKSRSNRDYHGSFACNDPGNADRSIDCLIFSFLVMDPDQFGNAHENEILAKLQERFLAEAEVPSLELKPEYFPAGIFRPEVE
jgi:pimeloyl-ACP methyl ester carboxylesterase